MARITYMAALLVVMFAAVASAAPCIDCKDCKGSNHCLSVCAKSCAKPQTIVNGEQCKRYGRDSSQKAAKLACENTLLYCNGGQQRTSVLGAHRYFPVSLGQCANIAYGTCQEHGMTRWRSPCGWAFGGTRSCNKDTFMKFYTGEINDRCNQAVAWIDQKAAEEAGRKP